MEAMKKCYNCGEEKPTTEFYKNKSKIDGLSTECRACKKQQACAYRAKNVEQVDKPIVENKVCSSCKIEKPSSEFGKNKTKCDGLATECKKCKSEQDRKYRDGNKDKITTHQREYWAKNSVWLNRKKTERLRNNLHCKIANNLRNRIRLAILNQQKRGSAVRDLGCSIPELIVWLEAKFHAHPDTGEVMSWQNYGHKGWHIDHIVPLDAFDLEDREQFLEACNYKNLQLLWAIENLKKSNKIKEI